MYINKLTIKNFRAFSEKHQDGSQKEYTFNFSPNLNCIAGHNGIGKSTLLAILNNVGELKKKHGQHLNGKPFRGEYSELIKGNETFDTVGEKIKVYFSDRPRKGTLEDSYPESLTFRATFQKHMQSKNDYKHPGQMKRYRLIPKRTDNRKTESKLTFPTFYLGLSRLYPIGESKKTDTKKINNEVINELLEDYNKILDTSKDINMKAELLNISETNNKSGFGVTTESYNYLANSAGQDNLGQILLSIYSFQELKNKLKQDYFGGVLLIDEIDATLHPAVQNKLIDYLLEKSKELRLQIFFTTHSNTLLEHLIKIRELTNQKDKNVIQINFLENLKNVIQIRENPQKDFITNNLKQTYSDIPKKKIIHIVTEDKVAENYLSHILEYKNFPFIDRIKYIDANNSWTTLMKLFIAEPKAFSNFIFVLDPDLNSRELRQSLEKIIKHQTMYIGKEIQILPGNMAIEKLLWEWINKLDYTSPIFYEDILEQQSIGLQMLINNGPSDNSLDSIKYWFDNNLEFHDVFFDYYIKDNENEINQFYNNFFKQFKKALNEK